MGIISGNVRSMVLTGNICSQRSAGTTLGCWHKRRWPLFLVIKSFLVDFFIPLFKTPEGVVVGFQIFAWAPN